MYINRSRLRLKPHPDYLRAKQNISEILFPEPLAKKKLMEFHRIANLVERMNRFFHMNSTEQ